MALGPVSNADYYGYVGGYFGAGGSASTARTGVSAQADEKAASEKESKDAATEESGKSSSGARAGGSQLTPEQQKQVDRLKATDQRVRAHEQAHVAAGGQYVRGGASFEYEAGPDGKRYAVGGEVSIDTSPEREPSATIGKMQVVRRAALAPADPSAQDRSVAASATQKELEARVQLAEKQREEAAAKSSEAAESNSPSQEKPAGGAPSRQSASPYDQASQGSSLDFYA